MIFVQRSPARRLGEIIRVLNKYGFDILLRRLRIHHIPLRKPSPEISGLTPAQRIKRILEELGPTFIKFGQILSTRSDLLPKEYIDELKKLQDRAPTFPFSQVREIVEKELQSKLEDIFEWFEEEPIASASLAQVHIAMLRTGEKVAVKVQRPGIEAVIEEDLALLSYLAGLAERRIPEVRNYNPSAIVKQLGISIRRELDFLREARNTERFAKNFKDYEYIKIPKVFWEYTTSRVLTLEYLEGIKIDEIERLKREGYDLRLIARRGAEAFMVQIFVFGFFQADPHPGNILVLPDNRLGFIDFGQVGRLRRSLKEKLVELAIAIVKKDAEAVAERLLDIGAISPETPVGAFMEDIEDLISEYYDVKLSQVNMAELIKELFDISLRYRIRLPPDFALLTKSIVTAEALARQLDPEFNITLVAEPFVKRLIRQRVSLRGSSRVIAKKGYTIGRAIVNVPLKLEALLDKMQNYGLSLRHVGFDNLVEELDALTNRIAFALITSAIIIGSSLVMSSGRGPSLFGVNFFGFLGFLFASLLGTLLLIRIVRSGRF